jgi:hypothetical protein
VQLEPRRKVKEKGGEKATFLPLFFTHFLLTEGKFCPLQGQGVLAVKSSLYRGLFADKSTPCLKRKLTGIFKREKREIKEKKERKEKGRKKKKRIKEREKEGKRENKRENKRK